MYLDAWYNHIRPRKIQTILFLEPIVLFEWKIFATKYFWNRIFFRNDFLLTRFFFLPKESQWHWLWEYSILFSLKWVSFKNLFREYRNLPLMWPWSSKLSLMFYKGVGASTNMLIIVKKNFRFNQCWGDKRLHEGGRLNGRLR